MQIIKNKKIISGVIIVLLFLFFGIFLFLSYSGNRLHSVSGEATEITNPENVVLERLNTEGEVFVMASDSDEWLKVEDGQEITEGSKVKTDGNARVQLAYPNGSVTRLDTNSELELKVFDASAQKVGMYLSAGRIWSRVAKLVGTGGSFETETDTVVASVRGTSFGIEILEDGTNQVFVTESIVDCRCKDVDQGLSVHEGWKVDFTCKPGDEVDTSEVTPEEEEDEWFMFNSDQDEELNKDFGEEYFNSAEGESDIEGMSVEGEEEVEAEAEAEEEEEEEEEVEAEAEAEEEEEDEEALCNQANKVYLCHKPGKLDKQLCVGPDEVDEHLEEGDYLGKCQ